MNFEIPTPTFSSEYDNYEEKEIEPEEEACYFPSLSSVCTDMVSRNLNVENAIDTYEQADHL
jgi:hypothetical protein